MLAHLRVRQRYEVRLKISSQAHPTVTIQTQRLGETKPLLLTNIVNAIDN